MSFVYVHVPFCSSKCQYCDFYSEVMADIPWSDYTDAIISHIRWWRDHFSWRQVEGLYFGGGTPSLMPVSFFGTVIDELSRWPGFSHNVEISVECNPDSLRPHWIKDILKVGINRMTIGIQTFDDLALKVLGRRYSGADALYVLKICREMVDNLGIDIMFGLPVGGERRMRKDIACAVELMPRHISFYQLTVCAEGGRWNGLVMPTEEDVVNEYENGRKIISGAGLAQYEISNFAVAGFECRHHLNCWKYGPYMGLGPGASSFVIESEHPFKGRRWKVKEDISLFMSGSIECDHEEIVGPKEGLAEMFMLGLRTMEGVSQPLICNRFDDMWHLVAGEIAELERDGWLKFDGASWKLTDRGLLVSDSIIMRVVRRIR